MAPCRGSQIGFVASYERWPDIHQRPAFFFFSLLISRRVRPLRSLDFNHRAAARWKMHLARTARTCRGSTKTYIISLGTMLISPFGNFRRQPFPTLRQHPLSFFFILTQLCGPLAETLRLFIFFPRFFKLE